MKSGFKTLCDVFDAITIDNITTKRGIADRLGLSVVSVSKATRELLDAGLISSSGSVPSGGRCAEAFSPVCSAKYAVVNLCEKPFTYSIVYLGESLSADDRDALKVKTVPYIRDLDFAENVARLANMLAELDDRISAAAIALPSPGTIPQDYLGDDIPSLFERRGISPLVMVTKPDALSASPTVMRMPLPSLYLFIGRNVRGVYLGRTALELDWDSIKVDGLKFSDVLRCASAPSLLAARIEKLIASASELLGVRSVMLDTTYITTETVDLLLDSIPYLEDVTFNSPVHEGLSHLLAEKFISEIPSAHRT
jgi:hypothetical protein